MTGLLQDPSAQPDNQMQEVSANPEEQRIYEEYFRAAMGEVLGNGQTFSAMMKSLEASRNNPIDGIARIALALYEKAENKLGPLDDEDITEAVGESIIESLLDMAVEAGVLDDAQVDEELAAAIYTKLAQMWIEANPERSDPSDIEFINSQKQGGNHGQ